MMAGQSAPHRGSRWSRLVEVFIRASEAGPATFTRYLVSHTVGAPRNKCTDPASGRREPEPDLTLSRLRRIGAVHQVELRFEAEIAADSAGRGLLHRVGCAGQLPHRRDRPWALHDRRHQRSRRDELEQVREERLAVMFGVVLAGQLVADNTHFQRRDGKAFAFDPADDLADQASLYPIGLDQQEGPVSHQRHSSSSLRSASSWRGRVTAHSVPGDSILGRSPARGWGYLPLGAWTQLAGQHAALLAA